ncbi:MAG: DUF1638 domain-containing protein [Candidatus Methanomethylophilaceae archaeon]|nr:DUF1638 domain-containing protein [Candidatus Methanomethylophilaceae archaeon]
MRIGIVACEIFKDELERITEGDADIVHKEYLEFALHIRPQQLRETVVSKANELKGKVDLVFLGYCYCQSLMGVTEDIELPAEMIHTDDCIGALLSPERYAEEKRVCAGTWFNSPGWAIRGTEGAIRELELDKADGIDPMVLLKMLFEGYSRCLFIDTGSPEKEKHLSESQTFAQELGLRHECTVGSLDMLQSSLRRAKEKTIQE